MRLLVPCPRSANDGCKVGMGGTEIQRLARGGRVCNEAGRIAGPPRLHDMRDFAAGLAGDCLEDLAYRETSAGAEIQSATGMILQEELERPHMGRREVGKLCETPPARARSSISRRRRG